MKRTNKEVPETELISPLRYNELSRLLNDKKNFDIVLKLKKLGGSTLTTTNLILKGIKGLQDRDISIDIDKIEFYKLEIAFFLTLFNPRFIEVRDIGGGSTTTKMFHYVKIYYKKEKMFADFYLNIGNEEEKTEMKKILSLLAKVLRELEFEILEEKLPKLKT